MTITAIAYYQFYTSEKNAVLDNQKTVLSLSGENLAKSINVIESIGDNISKELRLISYLNSGALSTSYSIEEYQYSISPIFEYSKLIQKVNAHSTRVFVHDTNVPESGNVFIHDTSLTKLDWYQDLLTSDAQSLWLGPHSIDDLQGIEGDSNTIRKIYSHCRKLFSSKGDYVGLLVINIYQDELFFRLYGLL